MKVELTKDIITWAPIITTLGTLLALFIAKWLERKGQKEGKEQSEMAHDLQEREQRWDQITETITYQRSLIDDLKSDLKDAKARVLRYVKHEEQLESLIDQHEAWDDMAMETNPDLPKPPPVRHKASEDPYFDL